MTLEQAKDIGKKMALAEHGQCVIAFKQFLKLPFGAPKAWDCTREIEKVLAEAGRTVSVRQRKASMLISWCTPKPFTGTLRVVDPITRHRAINPR